MEEKKPYVQLEKEYNDLRRLHNSMVNAVEGITNRMTFLEEENIFYKEQLVNADKRVVISKDIVANNIQQMSEENSKLVEEILLLKKEIKQLKG